MGLFSASVTQQINQIAAKSNEQAQQAVAVNTRSMNDDLNQMSNKVIEYFQDSPAILITDVKQLHEYVDKCIENGYAGIDTETTGLDRIKDHIVGASLYTPGMPECYIPMKHLVPLFDTLCKNQLTYEEVATEFQRFVDNKVKLIFANADFDLAMIYKDLKVDLIPAFYYDVISAWRCLREDEKDNSLKGLYAKYVMKGKVDPQKFSDFFSPKLFPYCKPKVAALYAANDAKITYDLFLWQLPYVTKTHEKCIKNHLERIADLVWNIEFPMVAVCAHLHRRGVFLDDSIASTLHDRYTSALHKDEATLAECVQTLIDTKDVASNINRPFRIGADFNPNSNPHVKYLLNNLLGSSAKTTGKEVLNEINVPATKAILAVRGDVKLLSTYVDKLPKVVAKDHRVHASYKSIGADTGRMCIAQGSYVNTSKGHKKIEDIQSGDVVFSFDLDTKSVIECKVVKSWKTSSNAECVKIIHKNNRSLICTPDHPILVDETRWVNACDLQCGDLLSYISVGADTVSNLYDNVKYSLEPVVKVIHNCGNYSIYDLEVESSHNFFVSNICVHNSSQDPNLQNIPSHALDIRHMFRATPESTEKREIDLDSGIIVLSRYDTVQVPEGKCEASQLEEGSHILLKNRAKDIDCLIVSVKHELGEVVIQVDGTISDYKNLSIEITHPPYVMMSSDFSQQEPRLSAFVTNDRKLVEAFKQNRDAYATLVSTALNIPYEECLEFHPVTGELQPEGKARRSIGKVLNLGITYGMSVQSIADSLFGDRDDMTEEQKTKEGQKIQDSLMKGFPDLAKGIADAQKKASKLGYTETILGRRRHHPNMMLPRFEFEPMPGYTNPDIDPLDPKSLENKEQIPKRIVNALTKEFNSYKWYGKIVKRTKELAEHKIKVVNNSYKIEEASRQCFNAVIQGSAADLTKMAMLKLEHDDEWREIGGSFINPIHDELLCEVPLQNAKKGAEVLARCMSGAGDFLPFPLNCDVETTFRWYGLPFDTIMEKNKPESLDWDNLSESNIEWLQCMIVENEYILPTFKEADGSKPKGVKARGVNGIITDELKAAIDSYKKQYNLENDVDFINHIEKKVIRGIV